MLSRFLFISVLSFTFGSAVANANSLTSDSAVKDIGCKRPNVIQGWLGYLECPGYGRLNIMKLGNKGMVLPDAKFNSEKLAAEKPEVFAKLTNSYQETAERLAEGSEAIKNDSVKLADGLAAGWISALNMPDSKLRNSSLSAEQKSECRKLAKSTVPGSQMSGPEIRNLANCADATGSVKATEQLRSVYGLQQTAKTMHRQKSVLDSATQANLKVKAATEENIAKGAKAFEAAAETRVVQGSFENKMLRVLVNQLSISDNLVEAKATLDELEKSLDQVALNSYLELKVGRLLGSKALCDAVQGYAKGGACENQQENSKNAYDKGRSAISRGVNSVDEK
jgi:hypothetical protein